MDERQRAARFSGRVTPARRPWSIAAVLAVAIVGCAVWGLVLVLHQGDPRLDSGVWLALVIPTERTADGPQLGQIRTVNTATGQEIDIGAPGRWLRLSWSHDGRRLFALELRGVGDDIRSLGLVIFDVLSGRRVADTDWPEAAARLYVPEGLLWAPDGSHLALPLPPFAGTLTADGRIAGSEVLGGQPSPGLGGTWAPDSARYAWPLGIDGLVIVAADGAATLTLPAGGAWWPAELQGPSVARQTIAIRWRSPLELSVRALTSERDPATGAVTGPTRFWELPGRVNPAGTEITWDPPHQLPDIAATVPGQADLAELFRNTGFDPGTFRSAFSVDRTFAGGMTIYHSSGSARNEPPRETWFVALIDGKRYAYSLGDTESRSIEALGAWRSWDIVRVP